MTSFYHQFLDLYLLALPDKENSCYKHLHCGTSTIANSHGIKTKAVTAKEGTRGMAQVKCV